MSANDILEEIYRQANQSIKNGNLEKTLPIVKQDVDHLIAKIGSNKSIVSALVTSLVKKIIDPLQDIRLHRVDFEGGYSARTLDTKYTSPFFKKHFSKYANKESSFLTLATRERIKWTKTDGVNLKIRNKKLRESFLNILDRVQNNQQPATDYLIYIFGKLIKLTEQDESLFHEVLEESKKTSLLNIQTVLEMLAEHFQTKLGSRLPVVAIYTIYELLLPKFERYKGKKLLPLQVHTASDKHGFGDVEINDEDDKPFEIIEIKHNIPIDKYLIFDVAKKISETKINRYYVLTTYQNGFASAGEEKEVSQYILQIKGRTGIDIIANGILTTLKYYLRFIDDYAVFVRTYTENLVNDSKNSTEIKSFHLEKWTEILDKNK